MVSYAVTGVISIPCPPLVLYKGTPSQPRRIIQYQSFQLPEACKAAIEEAENTPLFCSRQYVFVDQESQVIKILSKLK